MQDVSWTNEQLRNWRVRLAYQRMTTRDQAIRVIQELPEDSGLDQIIREISFLSGIETAKGEIARGQGMDAAEAKAQLREWVTG